MAVSKKFEPWAKKVKESLSLQHIRVEADLRDERIGYKIRQSSMKKIPYVIVIGEKESENQSVNVRSRDEGDLGEMTIEDFLEKKFAT